MVITIDSGK